MKCYCTQEMVKHDTGDYVCSDPKCLWIWDKDAESPFNLKYPSWIDKPPQILEWFHDLRRKSIPEGWYDYFLVEAEEYLKPKPNPHCKACGKEMGIFIQRTYHGRAGYCSYGCSL